MGLKFGVTFERNPKGFFNLSLYAAQHFGNDKRNYSLGIFLGGNTLEDPPSTGVFASAYAHGFGVSLRHAHTPGFGSTLSSYVSFNVLERGSFAVDVSACHTRTTEDNGLKYATIDVDLCCYLAEAFSTTLGITHTPKLNTTTIDTEVELDFPISLSRKTQFHIKGPSSGKCYSGYGFAFTYPFQKFA